MSMLAASSFAQCPNDSKIKWEAWVDPIFGKDTNHLVDDVSLPGPARISPYLTIQVAIDDVQNKLNVGEEGIVHLMPGLYSEATRQTFPIHMKNGVHVQGAGAKECVLRVRGGTPGPQGNPMSLHYPAAGTTDEPSRRRAVIVAVDFKSASVSGIPLGPNGEIGWPDEREGPTLDGVTIQGAEVQVSMEDEHTIIRGRVSNCVFDMRDVPEIDDEAFAGPDFGVLVCARYFSGNPPSGPEPIYYDNGHSTHYPPHHIQLFNNTFIQGALRDGEEPLIDFAKEDSVAICDFAEPMTPAPPAINNEDPDIRVRGINRHNVQNNLIRHVKEGLRTAMLGIDDGDAHCARANGLVVPRPTNAFDSLAMGTLSAPNGLYAVDIDPPLNVPTPRVDLSSQDPGFVGEYLTQTRGHYIRDFRILPDSAMLDQGVSPDYTASCGFVGAVNGLEHRDSVGYMKEVFDFDGEVHGNPRIVGGETDIGFDEIDELIIAGCYGNDTKSHYRPWDPGLGNEPGFSSPIVPTGLIDRVHVMRNPHTAPLSMPVAFAFTADFTLGSGTAWPNMPGSLPSPLFVPWAVWLDVFTYAPGFLTLTSTPTSWTNWQYGQVHAFGEDSRPLDDGPSSPPAPPALTSYFNSQIIFFDVNGNLASSNLQSEYY